MSEYVTVLVDDLPDLKRAERIVRRRDCVNYKPYKTYRHGTMNRCYDENGNTHRRDDSDFCSRGERRVDA